VRGINERVAAHTPILEILEGKENDIYYAHYSWYVICVQSSG
jgi:hypothetical protein